MKSGGHRSVAAALTGRCVSVSGRRVYMSTDYHIALVAIYSVVLLCGTASLSLMIHAMKYSPISTTSVAVLNLIFAHFIFLFTVPFRIYYYAVETWYLSSHWCRMVSAMIHMHMYMSLILYVIILLSRLLTFYNRNAQVSSFKRIHAVIGSVVVWIVVLVSVPCGILYSYGKGGKDSDGSMLPDSNTSCFKFGRHMENFKVINYTLSSLVIIVALLLTTLQANVLRVLYRKYQKKCSSQQDFGAQLKSFFFALIMVVCFVPYHIFRMYYLEHIDMEDINEVLLSLTTFNCLDMLTFLGRRTCYLFSPRRT
uniref:G protein-coupled receptor 141 n=1 Tax=Oryzias melastigma TaxID=30732 RepID=A0A3B3DJD8_ORYME